MQALLMGLALLVQFGGQGGAPLSSRRSSASFARRSWLHVRAASRAVLRSCCRNSASRRKAARAACWLARD
ncbi:hypothetical protein GCM10027514_39860 [Azotobacter armeniacus]